MRRDTIIYVVSLALVALFSTVPISPVAAQNEPSAPSVLPTDRTVLPIPEPQYPHSTVLDARNATPPPRFEVKAPAGAPNVLIVLIDDMGFGQSSAFGGPINMPTVDRLADGGLRYNQFHTTALCSPTRMALLTRPQPSHEQHGLDHGDGHRLSGQYRAASRERGPAGDDVTVQRLLDRRIREESRNRRLGGQSFRPDGPLADPLQASTSSTGLWAGRQTSGRRRSTTA